MLSATARRESLLSIAVFSMNLCADCSVMFRFSISRHLARLTAFVSFTLFLRRAFSFLRERHDLCMARTCASKTAVYGAHLRKQNGGRGAKRSFVHGENAVQCKRRRGRCGQSASEEYHGGIRAVGNGRRVRRSRAVGVLSDYDEIPVRKVACRTCEVALRKGCRGNTPSERGVAAIPTLASSRTRTFVSGSEISIALDIFALPAKKICRQNTIVCPLLSRIFFAFFQKKSLRNRYEIFAKKLRRFC